MIYDTTATRNAQVAARDKIESLDEPFLSQVDSFV